MAGTTTNDRLTGGAGRCSAGGGSGALRTLAVIHAGRRLVGALLAILLLMAAVLSGSAWAQPLGSRALGIAAETNKAPKVTKQPVKLTVEEGQSASFTSTASGVPTPTVQWELSTNGGGSWSPVEGATSTTITIASAKTSENGNQYRAVFKNGVPPDATSSAATLTVQKAPVVTQQPVSTTVEEGQSAVFEAAASGFPTPTIQWQLSTNGGATWGNVPGATSEKLTIANTKTSFSGHQYRAVFKNGTPPKEAISEAATLTVRKAPAVTKQPASTTVNEGQNATFEAAASGFPAPSVQWEVSTDAGSSWSLVEGATANTLTLEKTVASQSGNQYRAVFTNAAGSATSAAATLTVAVPPAVTQQPLSTSVEEGESATFEAAASGSPAPTIQWQLSTNGATTWANVSGATAGQLTIASTKTSMSGYQYRAVFTNTAGKATSEAATLSVHKAPAVTKQPANTTVNEGQSATFEATASGFPAPSAQWEISTDGGGTWSAVEGASSNTLTIASTTISEDGHQYRAVFTNLAGTATSAAAVLTVHAPPVVTTQPAGTTVQVGESASFEAAASGFPTPTVQWEISTNGGSTWSPVAGATANTLTIEKTLASESGHEYRAVFTNVAGKATSAAATLTVATTRYAALAWGQNLYRQLGDGHLEASSNVPVQVSGLTFVTSVAAGGRHSLGLLANGTAVAWGDDEFGQLGDGKEESISNVPVAVKALTGVKAIAAGENHSLALLSNGTVMAWGLNVDGQLGTGNNANSAVPVAVKGLTNVKAISAGGNHSLALLNSGTVMDWGAGDKGQLGTGKASNSNVPVAVKGLSAVTAISGGGEPSFEGIGSEFSLALLSKGTVQAWGSNESGQLGTGSEVESSTLPVAVSTLTEVTSIAAGAEHGLALLASGSVMAWGADGKGQLGNGVFKARQETPVAVSGISGVTAISAGGQDSAAVVGSGSVMAWGANKWGTLGNGETGSPSNVPVGVSGLRKVSSISVGGAHMLAFGEPIPVITSVSPNVGPTGGGTTVTISGTGFAGASAVKFGAAEATGVSVISATSITATAPAGTGVVDVTVTTPSGISPTGPPDRFTYQPAPIVAKLSPKSGPTPGGTSVTISGSDFTGATAVKFGEASAVSFKVNSATSITAISPAGEVGNVDVRVSTPGGTSAPQTGDRFKYTPVVQAITPNGGPIAGGTSVTVTGSGFALGSTATVFKFGRIKAKSVECTSSTSCTMITPAEAAGTVNVTATVSKVTSPINEPGDQFVYS